MRPKLSASRRLLHWGHPHCGVRCALQQQQQQQQQSKACFLIMSQSAAAPALISTPVDSTRRQDADLVGAEFLGQAFFDAKLLLDELQHNWALDLTDHQVCVGCVCGVGKGGSRRSSCSDCARVLARERRLCSCSYSLSPRSSLALTNHLQGNPVGLKLPGKGLVPAKVFFTVQYRSVESLVGVVDCS